jgi:DNA repair photolyase
MGCEHRCAFCYVRFYERRADRPANDLYGDRIRVKTNVAAVLREELARASWQRELVAVGGSTDPYQPAEAHYHLTRSCVRELGRGRTPFQIITRAPLIARDLDVLQEASRRAEVTVSFSIPTLDERIWRQTEPRTPHPRQRLRALRKLIDGGVRAGVGIAPILPGLSDDPKRLEEVVRAAREAGAAFVWAEVLHLREGTREHFFRLLEREWPELLARYENLYATRAYLRDPQKRPALALVTSLRQRLGIADRRPSPLRPPPEPEQLPLIS